MRPNSILNCILCSNGQKTGKLLILVQKVFSKHLSRENVTMKVQCPAQEKTKRMTVTAKMKLGGLKTLLEKHFNIRDISGMSNICFTPTHKKLKLHHSVGFSIFVLGLFTGSSQTVVFVGKALLDVHLQPPPHWQSGNPCDSSQQTGN